LLIDGNPQQVADAKALLPKRLRIVEAFEAIFCSRNLVELAPQLAFDADEQVIAPLLARGKSIVIPPGATARFNAISTKTPTRLPRHRHPLRQNRQKTYLATIHLAPAIIWLN
jgi:hypothetical protein